ncbi:hypothetical protein ACFE04_009593 [Oxalis oulophora]
MAYLDCSLLTKCTSLCSIKQFLSVLITTGLFQHYPSRPKLLELCSLPPLSNLSFALSVFSKIQSPSTNDYNAIIRGFARSAKPLHAITWYRSMLREQHRVDALTCSFTLQACGRVLALYEAIQLHSQVLRRGFGVDALLSTTLLDVYAKVGDIDSGQKLFDEMSVRDIASWNVLISGLAQGNRPVEALDLFKRMRTEGWMPNEVTVLGALSACAHLGALVEGEKVYEYIIDQKLDTNLIVCNAVIDMYAKCGFLDKACLVFDNMKCKKSRITWNTMIMAFATHGDAHKAVELFQQMGMNDVNPDSVSFLAVLCACNHAGLVDDGLRFFESMSKFEVEPSMKHFGTVVDLLGRDGRLQEAYDIVNFMPMIPDSVLWQSLLGACRNHNNVKMAETVSEKLVEMGSKNCGDFVLLSNVYAAQERWVDVCKVRDAMKNSEVKKVPACSYIEIKGVIHTFYTNDTSHSSSKEIYAKLDEIRFRINEFGYTAETGFVLHDIETEDKENALCYHGEKLAVAFGLIMLREGAPIQVIKNLRICGDCHTVIKLISKIYNREIIVRDRVRFHKFVDGVCSCRDYW